MSSLGEQGSTVIFVSHSMPQVLRLCTRGIWLDQGKVVMDGAISDVAAAYGAKQMNMTGEDYENYRPKDAKDPVRLVNLRALKADGGIPSPSSCVTRCWPTVCRSHPRSA